MKEFIMMYIDIVQNNHDLVGQVSCRVELSWANDIKSTSSSGSHGLQTSIPRFNRRQTLGAVCVEQVHGAGEAG
jgi:hypothetical protein